MMLSCLLHFGLAVAGKQPASFRPLACADITGTHWSCPPKSPEGESSQQRQARETYHLRVDHVLGHRLSCSNLLRDNTTGLSRDYSTIHLSWCPDNLLPGGSSDLVTVLSQWAGMGTLRKPFLWPLHISLLKGSCTLKQAQCFLCESR